MRLKFLALGGVLLLTLLQGSGCQAEPTLTITLGGDVILGRDGQAIFAQDPWGALTQEQSAEDGSRNWFMVNLESPLGSLAESPAASDGYNLCAPSEAVEILKIGGVDLVSSANNHREDCDETAYLSQELKDIAVVLEGQALVLESPGGIITILAADAVSKPLDIAGLLAAVAEIRGKTDVLIVSLHWGVEYTGEPTQLQRDQAKQLANAGVDVLWGHHPHVLQPAEWVKAEDETHRMLVLYSLGNLLTDQTMTYETRHSALIQLQFQAEEISRISFQPVALAQKSGKLVLVSPDEQEVIQISKRLGWEELLESFP